MASATMTRNLSVPIYAVIAVALPVVAYFLAALFNPQGWMSQNPLVIVWPLLTYWPLALVILSALVILAALKPTRKYIKLGLMPLLILLSIVYSVYLFYAVETAPQDEFTD